ncbi:hypothetical protein [Streptomyces carpinensis]|uniref:hypothetical protein n=1 Tax=Streptomyces carpinensis TaxID=66369 RepID=UPI001FC8FC16|nr:hypothetical protein [Streptomyces carpinensis]
MLRHDSADKPGRPAGTTGARQSGTLGAGRSAAGQAAGIPPEPTGAGRTAVLGAIRDVDARLTADEDKAIGAARIQCAALARGATNPDHNAALRFSYDGVTLTDDDGAHIDIGLRETLCPKP